MRGEAQAIEQDIPRLESENASLGATITQAEAELEAMYEALKGQTEPLRKKIETKQKAREPEAQALSEILSEEQLAISERQLLVDKKSAASSAIAEAEAELKAHHETVASSRKEVEISEAGLAALTKKQAELQAQQASSDGQEAALVEEHRSLRSRFEEGKAARSNVGSQSKRDAALMAAKQSGAIPGVIGRLGSLGSIDKKCASESRLWGRARA